MPRRHGQLFRLDAGRARPHHGARPHRRRSCAGQARSGQRRARVPQIRAHRRGSGSRAALFAGRPLHRVPSRRRAVQRFVRNAGRRQRRAPGDAHRLAHPWPHLDARRPCARVRFELRRFDGALRGRRRFGPARSRSASRRPNIPTPHATPTRSPTRFRARKTSSPKSAWPMRDVQTLAPSTGSDYAAALSPDGTRLAFVSDRGGQSQLWLYDRATRRGDAADRGDRQPRVLAALARRRQGASRPCASTARRSDG